MCGIIGYIGNKQASDVLIKGLQRMEYRGYDSAGVAMLNGELAITKGMGKVARLKEQLKNKPLKGHIGIGHTRWATHGEPNNINSHPHVSQSGQIALVHRSEERRVGK